MATRIGQYAPVCLPGDPPPWQRSLAGHTVYGVAQSWTCLKQPCAQRRKALCLRQLWPRGSGANEALLLASGALAAPCVQGHGPAQERWPCQGLFPCLCDQKASLASPSCSFAHWALRGLPCLGSLPVDQHTGHIEGPPPPHPSAGVLLCSWAHQSLKGAPWWGPRLHFSAPRVWWASLATVQRPVLMHRGERLW